MTLTLGDLKAGDKGRVVGFVRSEKGYRTRLPAMGFVKGTEFRIIRVAPLGDPVEVEVKGYNLSLRKEESRVVQVEKIKGE